MTSTLQPSSTFLSEFPFNNVPGNLFPPVCLKTHWDPGMILRRTLPGQHITLPQDFRPLVKVCKQYVSSAPYISAPMPPTNMVFPSGGEFYPPGRYSANIDKESSLRTLDRPLDKWCTTTQYIPSLKSNMYISGSTVPDRKHGVAGDNGMVTELSMPQALLRTDMHNCRTENDALYFERSGRVFNNPTKQDRYGADKYYANPEATHDKGEPMPHGGVNIVYPTIQAIKGRTGAENYPQPGGAPVTAKHGAKPIRSLKGAGTTYFPGSQGAVPTNKGCTSFVGVTTCGAAAPVW
jgi:hypothetical protein